MIHLLKKRNFSLLFFGNLVSTMGTTIYNFAISWYLYLQHVDPVLIGTYLATGMFVTLFLTPFAGVFVDRIDKVKILYISDFVNGTIILLTGYVFIYTPNMSLAIIMLFICTIILGISGAFFGPSISGLIPEVVEDNELKTAQATFTMIRNIRNIVGALMGAAFFELVGLELIFIINGISYILSGISEIFIKREYVNPYQKETVDGDNEVKRYFRDLKEGLQFIIKRKGLVLMLLSFVLINFSVTPLYSNAVPYLFSTILKVDSFQLSFTNIVVSCGMLTGSILIGNFMKNVSLFTSVRSGIIAQSILLSTAGILMVLVADGVISYVTFMTALLCVLFVFGISNMSVNIPLNTAIVRMVDQQLRGRVFSAISFMANIATPISIIIGGVLLQSGRMDGIVIMTVLITSVITLFFCTNQTIKKTLLHFT